ncbi:MAG: GtrA family protein [Anaerolineae bacterium]|nr:GtrA family protein [Anaerolineae bacterium]
MSQVNTIRNPLDRFILSVAGRFGSKSKEVERFLKFAIVGMMGAVVDVGTLVVLQATILPPRTNTSVIIATTIAFLAAVTHNFLWNRFWTYPDSRSRSVRRQMVQFTIVSISGWIIRTLWITLAYQPLGDLFFPVVLPLIHLFRPEYIPSATAISKLGTIAAQLIGIAVIVNWNFLANRFWTYNDVAGSDNAKNTPVA